MLLAAAVSLRAQNASPALPEGDGRDVLAAACSRCHTLDMILRLRDGSAGWKLSVDNMILRGAQVDSSNEKILVDYLARNFGPGAGPMPSGPNAAVALPEGVGKELVQARCTLCHDAGRIMSAKRTKQEWQATINLMMAKVDTEVSKADQEIMAVYLAASSAKR
jgi:cytochrome c5